MRRTRNRYTRSKGRTASILYGLAFFVLLLGISPKAHAGPWGREFGKGYAKLGVSYFDAEQSYIRGVPTLLNYSSWTTDLYLEIGLPYQLTAIIDVPYVVGSNESAAGVTFNNHSFGDGLFELDYQITQDWPLSFGVETKAPLYDLVQDQGVAGLVNVDDYLWSASNFPDPGDGNVDLTLKALAGMSLYPLPGWLHAGLGYRIRFDDFVDGIYGCFGAGYFIWPEHLALSFYTEGIINVQEDSDVDVLATKEYLYLQGEVLTKGFPGLPGFGLSVGAGGIPAAKNSSKGYRLNVSISYER